MKEKFFVINNIKFLENKTFKTEVALFDALVEAGVHDLGNYRSGGRNKELARKMALRYLEYKPLREIDPTCISKRAQKVIQVYDEPQEKEDRRGRGGKYTDKLKPLISHTAFFSGTRAELFDSWGMYDNYKEEFHITESQANSQYAVNFLRAKEGMAPGEAKYCSIINNKERDSLETTLNSMQKCGEIEWSEYYVYTPTLETDAGEEVRRILSLTELREKYQTAYDTVCEEAEKANCILNPKLYHNNMFLSTSSDTYRQWYNDYYQNGQEIGIYETTSEQARMYENYQAFIRQYTVYACNGYEGEYCFIEEIPNEYDIFTDFTYSRMYRRLDKRWRYLLGWEKVWKQFRFAVIDEDAVKQYLDAYHDCLGFELFQEYIQYMDSQLENDIKQSRVYFTKEYINDYYGWFPDGEYRRLFPLNTSVSANRLHNRLKKAYKL